MRLIISMLVCILPAWAFDADEYIAKLYEPLPAGIQALETRFFDATVYQREISPWLNAVESKLNHAGLVSLDASFRLLIDEHGRITNLELDDGEIDQASLREFISKLASLQFKGRPAVLSTTCVLVDAKALVISRNEKLEDHSQVADLRNLESDLSSSIIINRNLLVDHSYQATLISPEFFTLVRVGDEISFELEAQQYRGRVIDTGREIIIATDTLLVANESRSDIVQYWRLEQHHDNGTSDSIWAGAVSAGLGLGLASHGISTVAFAGLAALGSRLQDADVNLNAGDKFLLRKVINFKGVEKICKQ